MPLSSLRILIVDDYEPLLYLKAIVLRKAGAADAAQMVSAILKLVRPRHDG